jgi:hypothetical protein
MKPPLHRSQVDERGMRGQREDQDIKSHLVTAHVLQLLQDRQACIHPPVNAVLCACLLRFVKGAGGNLAGDALLPADFVEVVHG